MILKLSLPPPSSLIFQVLLFLYGRNVIILPVYVAIFFFRTSLMEKKKKNMEFFTGSSTSQIVSKALGIFSSSCGLLI